MSFSDRHRIVDDSTLVSPTNVRQVGASYSLDVSIVDDTGSQVTTFSGSAPKASTSTLSNVAGTNTSTTLTASNASRKGLIIFNDSSAILYIKFGATASSSSFTYRLNPYNHMEMLNGVIYTGIIDGIWVSATGNARVTEL